MKRFLLLSVLLACIVTVGNSQPALEYASYGFNQYYDISRWSLIPNSGSIDISGAPNSILFTSGNAGTFPTVILTDTSYISIQIPADGVVSLNWNYITNDTDGSAFDYPVYIIDGIMYEFPGFVKGSDFPQTGSLNVKVEQGQIFGVGAYTVDGVFGSCTINAFNFSAPVVPFALPAVLGIFGLAGIGAVVRFRRRKK